MRYFRLTDDIDVVGRWHLGDSMTNFGAVPDLLSTHRLPEDIKLSVPVTRPGRELDFCLTSFGVPVAVQQLAELIASVAEDVQVVRIAIDGEGIFREYCVPHCLREIECLDESMSEFVKWTDADGRPDLTGYYRMVTKLIIDRRVLKNDVHLFRVAKWPVALMVSEVLKNAMESTGCLGAKFEEIQVADDLRPNLAIAR